MVWLAVKVVYEKDDVIQKIYLKSFADLSVLRSAAKIKFFLNK